MALAFYPMENAPFTPQSNYDCSNEMGDSKSSLWFIRVSKLSHRRLLMKNYLKT